MTRIVICLLLTIVLILAEGMIVPNVVPAQNSNQEPDVSRIERLVKEKMKKDVLQLAPKIVSSEFLDEKGKAALQKSLTAYYAYRTSGFDHRRRVFAWQLLSSRIIFVMVILLVTVGLYFSWLQFRVDLTSEGAGEGVSTETTIEASAKGVKVSSPVLGVIILTLSLAFFYLYLVYVYPIEEIL